MPKSFIVYAHISPSKKIYIGITSQIPEKRFKAGGKGYDSCPAFWKAINKSFLCNIIKRQEERNGKTWRYKDA